MPLPIHIIFIEPGEESKSRAKKAELEDSLFEKGCARDSCLIAFGGGVITDLVGYIAGTFMRGIPFISIPTSLLAMVDASLGGKTGEIFSFHFLYYSKHS